MVERTIKKYSGEYSVFQIWKKLPRKITYQAYKIIISIIVEWMDHKNYERRFRY